MSDGGDFLPDLHQRLIYNYLVEFRRKELNKIDRAKLIRSFMNENNLSERKIGIIMGKSHSTIHDWLLFEKVTPEMLEELEMKNVSEATLYKLLRKNKKEEYVSQYLERVTHLDNLLVLYNQNLKNYVNKDQYTKDTLSLLDTLNRTLKRIRQDITQGEEKK